MVTQLLASVASIAIPSEFSQKYTLFLEKKIHVLVSSNLLELNQK